MMDAPCYSELVLYDAGRWGYHTFRIPAGVRTLEGHLLAFAEGRRNDFTDTGDIDLVMRRSEDKGRTWGELQVVDRNGPHTAGNPVPIVDQQ